MALILGISSTRSGKINYLSFTLLMVVSARASIFIFNGENPSTWAWGPTKTRCALELTQALIMNDYQSRANRSDDYLKRGT